MNGAVPDELARISSILGGGNASVAAPQRLPTPPPAQRAPPQAAHPAPIIDPASITDWSHAAKCVTKIAAQNPRFAERIKSMIDEQHAVEKEWQQLRTQPNTQSRDAMNKSQEHSTAIRALTPIGGIQSSEATPTSSEDREAETERFDMKCHDAMKHMDLMMSRELKGSGVPFFGTDPQLIVGESEAESYRQSPDRPAWSPKITYKDFVDLRQRMVHHSEIMYKD